MLELIFGKPLLILSGICSHLSLYAVACLRINCRWILNPFPQITFLSQDSDTCNLTCFTYPLFIFGLYLSHSSALYTRYPNIARTWPLNRVRAQRYLTYKSQRSSLITNFIMYHNFNGETKGHSLVLLKSKLYMQATIAQCSRALGDGVSCKQKYTEISHLVVCLQTTHLRIRWVND